MSADERTLEELASIDPETLQYLLDQLGAENVPAVQKTVQEVLDEPIPRAVVNMQDSQMGSVEEIHFSALECEINAIYGKAKAKFGRA